MTEVAGARTVRAGARWMSLFTLAWLAIWTVQLTPVQLLLPLQLDTPEDDWIRGVVSSGLVLGIGGLAGIIAGPAAGALSDRAAAGRHRRRPWAVGGALFTAACLALTGYAENPWTVGAGWVGVSIGVAVSSAAFTALIADQLPTTQRGAASAAVGSSQAVGIVVGVGLVVLLGLGIHEGYSCSRGSSRWSARPPLCCCRIPRPRRRCDRSRSDDAVWPRCEIGTSPGCSLGAS